MDLVAMRNPDLPDRVIEVAPVSVAAWRESGWVLVEESTPTGVVVDVPAPGRRARR